MTAEFGHAPGRVYIGQDGNLHLNGGSVYDANEQDITETLNLSGEITAEPEEINALDGVTPGQVTPSKALVVDGDGALDALAITALVAGTLTMAGLDDDDEVIASLGVSFRVKRFHATVTLATDDPETAVGLTPGGAVLSAAIRVSTAIAGLDSADHHIQLGINGTADKYVDVANGSSATTIAANKKGNYCGGGSEGAEAAALVLTITGGSDQTPSAGAVEVEVIYLAANNLADV